MSNEWITWVLKEAPVKDTSEVFMLLVLADSSNTDGVCYPSKKTMAKYMRMAPRSVARLIARLEEKTLVQRIVRKRDTDRGQTSNYYQLYQRTQADVDAAVKAASERREQGEGVTQGSPPHDMQVTPPMTQGSSQEPSLEPKDKKDFAPAIADAPASVPLKDKNAFASAKRASPATTPSPSLKPKDPKAEATTPPIPSAARPLSPAPKPRSEKQQRNDALVEALRRAWFTGRALPVPDVMGTRDYGTFAKVAGDLVDGGITPDCFLAYVQYWHKAAATWPNGLTLHSLTNNGRMGDFLAFTAKQPAVSTARGYDPHLDPAYAPLPQNGKGTE